MMSRRSHNGNTLDLMPNTYRFIRITVGTVVAYSTPSHGTFHPAWNQRLSWHHRSPLPLKLIVKGNGVIVPERNHHNRRDELAQDSARYHFDLNCNKDDGDDSQSDNRQNSLTSTMSTVPRDYMQSFIATGIAIMFAAVYGLAASMTRELGIDLEWSEFVKDPSSSFQNILTALSQLDLHKGMLYFSIVYILAEILALPAVPILTASSGYLFGLYHGTAACLFSASIAASVSFVIGRTLLRSYVEGILEKNPKFRRMDNAVGKEGFKLTLLLRLSPLFPFALSNYLYGVSSVRFMPYFFGTLLGFAPGTFAYVYAGEIGKVLAFEGTSSESWYIYLGGMALLFLLLKTLGDVAAAIIKAVDEEE